MQQVRKLFREPLVHFLLLGALLFLFSSWKSGPSGSGKIVVTRARIEQLATGLRANLAAAAD